ncbi:tetratricopeptide repeat protein [Candidatus Latescibacterota bacterium]
MVKHWQRTLRAGQWILVVLAAGATASWSQATPGAPAVTSAGGEADGGDPVLVQLMRQADFHASRGELPLAIGKYEEALELGAGSALVLNHLGELYLATGEAERAMAVFKRSLVEQPGQLPLYSRVGEAYLAMGRLDSAIHYVQKARALAPGVSTIRSSLGFLYFQAGDLPTARAHLDSALQLEPNSPEAHRFLGLLLAEVDSSDLAVAHFEKVIEVDPDDVQAYNNIAFLRARGQQYAEALEYYREAKKRTLDANLLHAINMNMEAVRAIMDGKMRARFILVSAESIGRDLLQRLVDGEDFGELAVQFSEAPNARDGGDLGFFGPGDMLPAVEKTVLQLEVGQVSDVIRLVQGFMLIQRLN